MKTLIILSDTHGNHSALEKLSPLFKENDYLVFCGDGITDIEPYKNFPKIDFIAVHGNCDGGSDEKVINVDGTKILVTHGHMYGVKYSMEKLYLHAKELGVKVVLYGHTHHKDITEYDGIQFINPGTLGKYSTEQSYCYMVVHNGKVTATLVDVFY